MYTPLHTRCDINKCVTHLWYDSYYSLYVQTDEVKVRWRVMFLSTAISCDSTQDCQLIFVGLSQWFWPAGRCQTGWFVQHRLHMPSKIAYDGPSFFLWYSPRAHGSHDCWVTYIFYIVYFRLNYPLYVNIIYLLWGKSIVWNTKHT